MPGKWVGGPGSLACPQRGQFIEARVFDDSKKEQGTIFLEVKRLFGTGSSGRTFLGDLVTATDEYYRYWAASPEGIPSTVDGNYHLCRGDPRSCVGGAAGTVVVHLRKWRTWPEEELAEGKVPNLPKEATIMMNRYFKGARKDDPEKKAVRSGLPWGEGKLNIDKKRTGEPEQEENQEGRKMLAKKARITAMEKELRALKAEVEKEDEKAPRRSRSKGARAKKPRRKEEEVKKKKALEVEGLKGRGSAEGDDSEEIDSEDDEESSSEEQSAVRGEAREKEKKIQQKAKKAKEKRKGKDKGDKKKKKDKKAKDRGPFGMAPTEEWDKDEPSKDEYSDSDTSGSGSSFQKAPSLTSRHMKLVRYAKRRPGRLAIRLLRKMEKSTGFGGGRNKVAEKDNKGETGRPHVLPGNHDSSPAVQVDSAHAARVEDRHNAARPTGRRERSRSRRCVGAKDKGVGKERPGQQPVAEGEAFGTGRSRRRSPGGSRRGGYDGQGGREGGQNEEGLRVDGTRPVEERPRKGSPRSRSPEEGSGRKRQRKEGNTGGKDRQQERGDRRSLEAPGAARKPAEPEEPLKKGEEEEDMGEAHPGEFEEDPEEGTITAEKNKAERANDRKEFEEKLRTKLVSKGLTLKEMGKWLMANVSSLQTKFGNFKEKLDEGAVEKVKASGPAAHDLLPISVESVWEADFIEDAGIRGWATFSCLCLNFWYCAGWDRADHLEHPRELTGSQKDFLLYHLIPAVERMLEGDPRIPRPKELEKLLSQKGQDYEGNSWVVMEQLESEKVVKCWPEKAKQPCSPSQGFWREKQRRWWSPRWTRSFLMISGPVAYQIHM
jgi:hypothetical protein